MSGVEQAVEAYDADVLDLAASGLDHDADPELGHLKEALSVVDEASCCR